MASSFPQPDDNLQRFPLSFQTVFILHFEGDNLNQSREYRFKEHDITDLDWFITRKLLNYRVQYGHDNVTLTSHPHTGVPVISVKIPDRSSE